MQIDILTIFPGMFKSVFSESMLKIALKKKVLKVRIIDIRDFTLDRHRKVDDKPYGGGAGMVMSVQPIYDALMNIKPKTRSKRNKPRVILLSPRGVRFDQPMAKKLSKEKHLILIAGHYEGVDERLHELVDIVELSIGDYILSGGELAAMVVVDALSRLQKGSLGNEESALNESFENNLLEYPQYTRPAIFKGLGVPEVLLSGDHKKILKWRLDESVRITKKNRPDLVIKTN